MGADSSWLGVSSRLARWEATMEGRLPLGAVGEEGATRSSSAAPAKLAASTEESPTGAARPKRRPRLKP